MSLSVVVYFTMLSASQIVWWWQKDLMKLIGRNLEKIATIPAYLFA